MVPVGDGRRKPAGGGGRQPADTAVRPNMVVVVAPGVQHRSCMAQRREQGLIEAFVAQAC